MKLQFKFNDGGRSTYFKAEYVGDCVTRAIAIASGRDYKEIYDMVNAAEKAGRKHKGSARNGAYKENFKSIIEKLGGVWVPTMSFGNGCQVHLAANEVPMEGRIIVRVSRHLTAVINGVINDTYDCSREGTRCVYGYWKF